MLDQAQLDQAQLDQALRRYWHPVAVSEDVTDEPRQVRLLGENIVVYRDSEGLVAMRDKCVHRGVALSGGCIRDGLLMCPYHGWQYDRTGKVAFIPALGADGAIPSQARVHRYHVREQYGAVWVAPEAPTADPPPWPDDDWDSDEWHVFMVGTWVWAVVCGPDAGERHRLRPLQLRARGLHRACRRAVHQALRRRGHRRRHELRLRRLRAVARLHAAPAVHAARPQVGGGRQRRGDLVRAGRLQGWRRHHHHVHRLAHRPGRDPDLRVAVAQPLLRPPRLPTSAPASTK